MTKINFLKPDNRNLFLFLSLGLLFIFLAIIDFSLNNFLGKNITSFLPRFFNFFTPLIFGIIGFHLIRIEFSGIKNLDLLNKNINTSNFNAALSLFIIFLLIFCIPPLFNWFIFDANISGNSKEACTGSGACWVYIKVWFNRFMYGMYPNTEQWRINLSFAIVLAFAAMGFLYLQNIKNI
jgi:general L-amino acid transport system permease protein